VSEEIDWSILGDLPVLYLFGEPNGKTFNRRDTEDTDSAQRNAIAYFPDRLAGVRVVRKEVKTSELPARTTAASAM